MPGCSKSVHPSGVEITFTEDDHRYFSEVGGREIVYESCTTFVHRFFPEFDPDGSILRRKALKEGKAPEELKAEWDRARDESCRFGTRIHEVCEDVVLGRTPRNEPASEKERLTFAQAEAAAALFRRGLDVLAAEKMVAAPFLPRPLAGTVDLLARSRKDGSVLVLDWKTSKTIDRDNRWNKFGLDPIRHIPDLNYWHYACQLSLYQYLLEFGKYVPKGSKFKRALIHLTETSHEIIQLPDLTNEVKDMIIWDSCDFGRGRAAR